MDNVGGDFFPVPLFLRPAGISENTPHPPKIAYNGRKNGGRAFTPLTRQNAHTSRKTRRQRHTPHTVTRHTGLFLPPPPHGKPCSNINTPATPECPPRAKNRGFTARGGIGTPCPRHGCMPYHLPAMDPPTAAGIGGDRRGSAAGTPSDSATIKKYLYIYTRALLYARTRTRIRTHASIYTQATVGGNCRRQL
jgi:hypothetical protein